MKRIHLEIIPASEQRYRTCGDYWEDSAGLEFRVSAMSDWRAEACVFLHEFVEAILCKQRGIPFTQIDAFDMGFQGEGEPGDDPTSPYRAEHREAENIERIVVTALGLHWDEYAAIVEAAI